MPTPGFVGLFGTFAELLELVDEVRGVAVACGVHLRLHVSTLTLKTVDEIVEIVRHQGNPLAKVLPPT